MVSFHQVQIVRHILLLLQMLMFLLIIYLYYIYYEFWYNFFIMNKYLNVPILFVLKINYYIIK